MKKIWGLMCAAMMCTAMFTACDEADTQNKETTTTTTTATTTTVKEDEIKREHLKSEAKALYEIIKEYGYKAPDSFPDADIFYVYTSEMNSENDINVEIFQNSTELYEELKKYYADKQDDYTFQIRLNRGEFFYVIVAYSEDVEKADKTDSLWDNIVSAAYYG